MHPSLNVFFVLSTFISSLALEDILRGQNLNHQIKAPLQHPKIEIMLRAIFVPLFFLFPAPAFSNIVK